jgi:hypothetical protein
MSRPPTRNEIRLSAIGRPCSKKQCEALMIHWRDDPPRSAKGAVVAAWARVLWRGLHRRVRAFQSFGVFRLTADRGGFFRSCVRYAAEWGNSRFCGLTKGWRSSVFVTLALGEPCWMPPSAWGAVDRHAVRHPR